MIKKGDFALVYYKGKKEVLMCNETPPHLVSGCLEFYSIDENDGSYLWKILLDTDIIKIYSKEEYPEFYL